MTVFLVLDMIEQSAKLRQIVAEHMGLEILKHIKSNMLDWVGDMKQADGLAEWSSLMMEQLMSRAAVT